MTVCMIIPRKLSINRSKQDSVRMSVRVCSRRRARVPVVVCACVHARVYGVMWLSGCCSFACMFVLFVCCFIRLITLFSQ